MSKWQHGRLFKSGFLIPLLVSGPAFAQSVTGTIDVSIELTAACEVNESTSTSGVDFGSLDFGSHSTLFVDADAEVLNGGTAIEVLCSPGVTPSFQISGGANDGDSGSQNHAMADGSGNFVPYSIFTDAARTSVLDAGTPHALSGTADGVTPQTLALYGRAYGQPGLAAGSYSDTLNVELSF
ncbi:spore coat U domain-containing protein [Halomonas sp. I1]|uniref:Csu type fimbrial protein n=1 Tax=Halomonas sp. I1 TaxID=393536 RepID=UPI0028E02C8F|nr:spore coat U domain-containing protein [Halomonas sp. I1]MDT8893432.1 spore coat U domain-containing protein [Halomonas sp. I1]